jgi:DNA-binding NarL/FixJ family response regulator
LRILIADSHEVIRRTVRTTLDIEPTWTVCAEATTGLETLARVSEFIPDVIVLDVGLPGLTTLDLTREIRRAAPDTHVVALTMHASRPLAQRLNDAGAHACVPKADVGRSLVNAIKALIGSNVMPETAADPIPDDSTHHADTEGADVHTASTLTMRERQVMQLLAEGKSNKEIGNVLMISAKTVETYRARIMGKLGLRSMNQLVRYAIRHRIITA